MKADTEMVQAGRGREVLMVVQDYPAVGVISAFSSGHLLLAARLVGHRHALGDGVVPHPSCRTLHFPLLDFRRSLLAHYSVSQGH